jgi:hypothetical protein
VTLKIAFTIAGTRIRRRVELRRVVARFSGFVAILPLLFAADRHLLNIFVVLPPLTAVIDEAMFSRRRVPVATVVVPTIARRRNIVPRGISISTRTAADMWIQVQIGKMN